MNILRTTLSTAMVTGACVASAAAQNLPGPFQDWDVSYHGPSVATPSLDGSHHVMYDPEDAARPFKMWWHSSHADNWNAFSGGTDRIYFASSTDGVNWTEPVVALAPRGGDGGFDAADDHLVGSPTVLKVNGTYYMFYEAYGNWTTTVARFFSPSRGDTWTHAGNLFNLAPALESGYELETVLGFAPMFEKHGTHPIYAGEVVYPDGKRNRFLSCSPIVDQDDGNTWIPLVDNRPVLFLYDSPGPGRVPLFQCFDATFGNTFASLDPGCEPITGLTRVIDPTWCENGLLGYVAASTSSPDMAYSNQNAICLATSTDGVNWTRVHGSEHGGALLSSEEAYTTLWPHDAWASIEDNQPLQDLYETIRYDVYPAYGSGFPNVLTRDGHIELIFTDDTMTHTASDFPPSSGAWRIRLPLSQIANPAAYAAANRQSVTWPGGNGQHPIALDLKWSDMFQRYFYAEVNRDTTPWTIRLYYSGLNPDPTQPNGWVRESWYDFPHVDLQQGWAFGAAMLSTTLGRTADFPDIPNGPYTTFGMYYQRSAVDPGDSVLGFLFETDIHYMLMFAWPDDRDGDRVPDWLDGCPDDPEHTVPGPCGCGPTPDADGDGIPDCDDPCPLVFNPDGASCSDCDGDGVSDDFQQDSDGDGVIDPCDCDADLDGSGYIDFNDLNLILDNWATTNSAGDVDGDGIVSFTDLNNLLADWNWNRPCPAP